MTTTLTFSNEQDRFLQAEVAAGRYRSVEGAVRAAVDRMRRERNQAEIRNQLAEGLAELDRGEGIEIDSEEDEDRLFDEILSGNPQPREAK